MSNKPSAREFLIENGFDVHSSKMYNVNTIQAICEAYAAALSESAGPRREEIAWLVERAGLCVGFCGRSFAWVTFTNEAALRFSRKQDADGFIAAVSRIPDFAVPLEGALATEHSWVALASSPAPRGADELLQADHVVLGENYEILRQAAQRLIDWSSKSMTIREYEERNSVRIAPGETELVLENLRNALPAAAPRLFVCAACRDKFIDDTPAAAPRKEAEPPLYKCHSCGAPRNVLGYAAPPEREAAPTENDAKCDAEEREAKNDSGY